MIPHLGSRGDRRLLDMTTDLDPSTLASQRCVAADASTPALARDEVTRLAAGLDPAWQVLDDRLVREFAFPAFGAAFGLATRIALLAEGQGHHPALEVAWGRLTVTWTTDAIGAITANDLIMAAKVDRMVARGLALKDG
jgi:4a-hydroxytetrahydrobiopterin dehydratase